MNAQDTPKQSGNRPQLLQSLFVCLELLCAHTAVVYCALQEWMAMSEPLKLNAAASTIQVTVIDASDLEGQIQLTTAQDDEEKQQDSGVLLQLFLLGFLFVPAWWMAIFLGWRERQRRGCASSCPGALW